MINGNAAAHQLLYDDTSDSGIVKDDSDENSLLKEVKGDTIVDVKDEVISNLNESRNVRNSHCAPPKISFTFSIKVCICSRVPMVMRL